ncbi:hypothetical protein [Bartonella bovis]|uniref:hypothetical protein n=1 Tax=Bartonella bovis TaxID=155194 RepID=UPI000C9AFD81|nr:hypothetical protein [Bartonella bovis]
MTNASLTDVNISQVEKGVLMKGAGRLTIKEGTRITFKSGTNNSGIGVWGEATATITGTRITGEGSGQGTSGNREGNKGVIIDGTTLEMTNVDVFKCWNGGGGDGGGEVADKGWVNWVYGRV